MMVFLEKDEVRISAKLIEIKLVYEINLHLFLIQTKYVSVYKKGDIGSVTGENRGEKPCITK